MSRQCEYSGVHFQSDFEIHNVSLALISEKISNLITPAYKNKT